MKRAAIFLPALALAAGAGATAPGDSVSLRLDTSHLDRGYAPWREQALAWRRAWQSGESLELGVAAIRRFDLEDQRLSLAWNQRLSKDLALSVEAAWSPSPQVLARSVAGARVSWNFQPQWVAYAGARTSDFREGAVHQGTLALERYVGPFSVTASWMPSRALGASTSAASLRGDWYYADRSSVGVIAAQGREATRLGPASLVLAEVRTTALVGRHALSGPWSLGWGVERVHQGDFYTRTGASVALQRAF